MSYANKLAAQCLWIDYHGEMWANSIWGFIGVAVALVLAALGMQSPTWKPVLYWSAGISSNIAVVILIWPLFRRRRETPKAAAPGATVAPGVTVASFNQSGGQTAQTIVNQAPPARSLTAAQVSAIQAAVSALGTHRINIIDDGSSPDGKTLSGQFGRIFQGLGWSVNLAVIMGPITSPSPPTGLALQVSNASALTPVESAIVQGLRSAALNFDIQQQPMNPASPIFADARIRIGSERV
jgi:hypothetical protein